MGPEPAFRRARPALLERSVKMDNEERRTRTELQDALASLASIVVGDAPLPEVLANVAKITADLVPGAETVSVTLVDADGSAHSEAFTDPFALTLDQSQYANGEGPCLHAAVTRTVVVIDDMATDPRWPEYCPEAAVKGAGSSPSIGFPQRRSLAGALNIYATRPHAFDSESIEAATAFAGYATVALTNITEYDSVTQLADQLTAALESRAVIDQAKGVLMAQRGCTPDEAFEILRLASQNYNRKLRDIASGIVESARQNPAP